MMLPAIHYEHSHLTAHERKAYEHRMQEELAALQDAAKGFYEDDRASINLPVDGGHLKIVRQLAARHKKASLIIVVGIGGSNLGTIAVQEAVLGKLHNVQPGKRPRILYADTTDPDSMARINAIMEEELRRKRKVLINAVSKSGGTTETIANFEIFLQTLKRYRKSRAAEHVVVTTDEGSHFWSIAQQEGFAVLPIPKKVGGRYSVLSPVGLFPLAVLGVNIERLLEGAAAMRSACLKAHDNPAMLRAAVLAHTWARGKNIIDNFYFKTDLESVGKWYRQLMGESIGKEWNREHTKRVWRGLTPTVSIGSTDLHSMAQLYFGGPKDKLFTIVTVRAQRRIGVPRMQQYDALVHNIQGKQLASIMEAISSGVQATLRTYDRPYCVIELPDATERSIGALLQLHMMEMMYLAALLDVNPFDQPNVEDYKIETKRILARRKS